MRENGLRVPLLVILVVMQENKYFLFSSDILEKRKRKWDYRLEKRKPKKVENGQKNTRKVLIVKNRKDSLKNNIVVLEEKKIKQSNFAKKK